VINIEGLQFIEPSEPSQEWIDTIHKMMLGFKAQELMWEAEYLKSSSYGSHGMYCVGRQLAFREGYLKLLKLWGKYV
jgi:hypothetical protein